MTETGWEALPTSGDPLDARTFAEAALYLRVRGAAILAARRRDVRGKTLLEFRAVHDGAEKRFAFWLHRLDVDDLVALGGAAPSKLLDPVDLVLFAAKVERELPERLDGVSRKLLQQHLADLELAAEAVLETFKFIPAGTGGVPRETVTTRAAEWLYDKNPDRFTRASLTELHGRLLRRAVWYQEVLRLAGA